MKRFYLSLIAIAAIAALTAAGSFALFTASTTNANNTFTAGTVKLGDPSFVMENINNIAPGDHGDGNYTIQYKGNLEAWLGVDTAVTGDLMTCDATPLGLTITGNSKTFDNNLANQVIGKFTDTQNATINVAWNLPITAGNGCQGDSATVKLTVHAVQVRNNDAGTGPISWLEDASH